MTVDREQIRRDANFWLDDLTLSREPHGSPLEPRADRLARHCLALLAELVQAEREQDEAAWPRLDHWRERAQVAEVRLAKVPSLVEALRGIAGPKQLRDATNGWLEAETEWCCRTARAALAAWESE